MGVADYGAIAFKNGMLISTDTFTPMIDMVGWEDKNFSGQYFAYVGDSDNTLAFYKTRLIVLESHKDGTYEYSCENFCSTNYVWLKWESYVGNARVVVTKRNGYFVCKWKYKNDKYKVYFGYGVDLYSYKKYRIVNAYRVYSAPVQLLLRIVKNFRRKR